jgi:hypothetical protein
VDKKLDPGRSSGQENQEEGSCEDLWSLKNLWLERETQELGPLAYTEHEIAGGEVARVGKGRRRRKREEMATKGHAQWNFR